ncbi:MAG TPA: metallophosphoesterase [Polyangia bacterium]|nr:metallophosphoesterase [Polyangia bacterium]
MRVAGFAPLIVAAAVSIGCRGRSLGLALSGDAVAAPAPPAPTEEPREIHYTFTAPDTVTFDWRGSDPTLRVWSKGIAPRTIQARPPVPLPMSCSGPWQEAVVDGLKPATEYAYEVGHPVRAQPLSFRSPAASGALGFTFVAVGDIGASTSGRAAAVDRLIALADPTFVLALGDLTYGDEGAQADVDCHFDDVMAWSQRAAYMPTWGNHEWEGKGDDLRNYKGRFALPHAAASPGAPAAGCCGEDWYWFDQGAVRFIIYPEPYTKETWRDWARKAEPLFVAAQTDPALRFIVTAGHRPAYSSGHHGGEPQLRAILDDFGRRFGKYVLNLSGHAHAYERTKPQAHVVHVTAGIGGSALEHAATSCLWHDCKPPAFTAFRAIHHGFVKLTARRDGIALQTVCAGASPKEDSITCADGDLMDEALIAPGR